MARPSFELASILAKSPNARQLLDEHAMQLGVDLVRCDHQLHETRNRLLDGQLRKCGNLAAYLAERLVEVAIEQRRHQRFFAGEVLIERTHARARLLRHAIGVQRRVALSNEEYES